MPKLKFLEKVLLLFLVVVFITTFFFSTIFSLKPISEDARFFIIGLVLFAMNIGVFFWTIKILKKHFDQRNHKGIRWFYYPIFIISILPTLGFLAHYNNWLYMLVYFVLVALYAYLINKEFGRLSIKINKDHDGDLFAGDLYTFNGDIKVRGKNKKMKGSIERLSVGDTIIISRDSETILTLNIVKNAKKS